MNIISTERILMESNLASDEVKEKIKRFWVSTKLLQSAKTFIYYENVRGCKNMRMKIAHRLRKKSTQSKAKRNNS